jgi:arabinose-5-phosphate isomerase
MLALGDALAVALQQSAGFTPQHFAVFHPGGKLGSLLMRVDS